MNVSYLRIIAPAIAFGMLAACSAGGGASSGSGNASHSSPTQSGGIDWASNGARACEQYLTPEFVAQIFEKPTGQIKRLAGWSCSYTGSAGAHIGITLQNAGVASFDAHQQFLVNPTPLAGVGDKAVFSALGIEAVKGDRMCSITLMPLSSSKLSGDALAHKLGEVCNKLFALP